MNATEQPRNCPVLVFPPLFGLLVLENHLSTPPSIYNSSQIRLYNPAVLGTADINAQQVVTKQRPGVWGWIAGHYTRQTLWALFLMCALPLHIWTLLLAFRDISWVTDRTNAWDAVGVVAYGLLFAFIESVVLFAVAALLGYLVPNCWDARRRVALLTVLVWVLSIWAMLDQLYFLVGGWMPGWLIDIFVRSGHPARLFYALLLSVVGLSVLAPALLVIRSERASKVVWAVIDRLSILMMFYLVLDALGLVIVLIRNL